MPSDPQASTKRCFLFHPWLWACTVHTPLHICAMRRACVASSLLETHLSEMPGYSRRALRSAIAVGVSGVATCRATRVRRTKLVHPPGQCSWVRFWRSSQSSATRDTSGCRAMHRRGAAVEPPVDQVTFKLRVPGCELPSRSFAVRPSRQAMTCDACPESWIGRRRRRRGECVERLPWFSPTTYYATNACRWMLSIARLM